MEITYSNCTFGIGEEVLAPHVRLHERREERRIRDARGEGVHPDICILDLIFECAA